MSPSLRSPLPRKKWLNPTSYNVAADTFLNLVGLHHHGQRIPAHEALDAALDLTAAGKRRLLLCGDGIDVRGVRREGLSNPVAPGVIAELAKEAADSRGAAGLKHVVERFEPLSGFEGVNLRGVFRGCIAHESSTAARADR